MKLFCIPICFFVSLSVSCSNCNQAPQSKTDTSLNKKSAATPISTRLENETTSCKELAYQVLISSSRYKELTKGLAEAVIKNGGSSYGIDLEGSPHPEADTALQYSKTYDFALHETYADRNVTTARFTVDLLAGKLFEYQAAEDSLTPVDFNKALLLKPYECK